MYDTKFFRREGGFWRLSCSNMPLFRTMLANVEALYS
jgi:hypothetical protein